MAGTDVIPHAKLLKFRESTKSHEPNSSLPASQSGFRQRSLMTNFVAELRKSRMYEMELTQADPAKTPFRLPDMHTESLGFIMSLNIG